MYIAILGRQPALGIAELECVFGGSSVKVISNQAAVLSCDGFDIQRFGGIPKAGIVVDELPKSDWHKVSQKVVQYYSNKWSLFEGKITLGISSYGFNVDAREVQKTGIILKQKLKKSGVSLRLVPNPTPSLNSAISHHNKLGLSPNKIELLIVQGNDGKVIIAESTGSQNITAYASRDQMRPKRDAFVGMLPPKLAQIMINLAVGLLNKSALGIVSSVTLEPTSDPTPGLESDVARSSDATNYTQSDDQDKRTILDPFCGTGVILQEAVLMGYSVYGTDLSEKMIRYSRDNLNWLADSHHTQFDWFLREGDAMNAKWQQPIDAVVSEVYLGQPFSAPPSPTKLDEVRQNCNHIISEFLKNLAPQIQPGTPVCIAVPAWRNKDVNFTHLPLISTIARLGYKPHEFTNISQNDLLYYRENQIVARELMILTKI
jgi:tRNA G10  N-methylase Trm11